MEWWRWWKLKVDDRWRWLLLRTMIIGRERCVLKNEKALEV